MILSTYPDRAAALRAARRVVGTGLAACVNITDVTSVYTWQGRIEEDPECLAVFKTTRRASKALARSIVGAHPYEVPEVVEIGLRGADRQYAQWLAESTAAAADATATEGGSEGAVASEGSGAPAAARPAAD